MNGLNLMERTAERPLTAAKTRIPINERVRARMEVNRKLAMSTAEIGLSVRTTNCLDEQGITTVEDLLRCKRADLMAIQNFGEKTLEEVYAALERLGFFRKDRRNAANSEVRTTPTFV